MKLFALLTYLFVLSGCATVNKQAFYYNEIVIRNNTNRNVSNVSIIAEKANAVFSCNIIPPGTACSNKFRKRKYLGNPIKISWSYHNAKRKTERFALKLPQGLDAAFPLRGVLEVNNGGMIKPYFEQNKH